MNNTTYSPTEGFILIEMPGRGVSLQRVGKSGRKCGHRDGKAQFKGDSKNSKPTVVRAGYEITRELESRQTVCHQKCNISEEVAQYWANEPFRDEYTNTPNGKKFTPKYKPEQRFTMRLAEHVDAICIAANILPERTTWTWTAV